MPPGWSVQFRLRLPSWRVMVWLVIAIIVFITLWRGVDNWLGKRVWDRCMAEASARGVRVEWEAYIPPPVPDNGNFALTPSLAPLYNFIPGTQQWRDKDAAEKVLSRGKTLDERALALHFNIARFPSTNWPGGQAMDLLKILEFQKDGDGLKTQQPQSEVEAAQLVIELIQEIYGHVLAEIKEASLKPFARFNVRYDHVPLIEMAPIHMSVIGDCVKTLSLRASAQLILQKTDRAFDDLILAIYLTDIVKNEPLAGSNSRRRLCRSMINTALLTGLVRHQWSDDQLRRFQSSFEKENFPLECYRNLLAERAHNIRVIDQIRKGQDKVTLGAYPVDMFDELEWDACVFLVAHVESSGWFYRQAADYSLAFDKATAPMESWLRGECDTQRCLSLLMERRDQFLISITQGWFHTYRALREYRLMTAMFLTDYAWNFGPFLRLQVKTAQAVGGCALERFYLAHHQFPEKLEELIPHYMKSPPLDSFSGKPLQYRRDASDAYTLYSVGDNFVDDGGKSELRPDGGVNSEKGDLIWRISGK